MNIWFLLAGLAALFVCVLHIFGGGKISARPLLESSDLKPVAKYTNYYCWHLVTINIAALGVMFMVAAFVESAIEIAWAATIIAGLYSIWNVILYVWKRDKFRNWYALPQWLLFLPVAVLGGVGSLP